MIDLQKLLIDGLLSQQHYSKTSNSKKPGPLDTMEPNQRFSILIEMLGHMGEEIFETHKTLEFLDPSMDKKEVCEEIADIILFWRATVVYLGIDLEQISQVIEQLNGGLDFESYINDKFDQSIQYSEIERHYLDLFYEIQRLRRFIPRRDWRIELSYLDNHRFHQNICEIISYMIWIIAKIIETACIPKEEFINHFFNKLRYNELRKDHIHFSP